MKGLSLSEANIKIVLVGSITITSQAKNIKDDKLHLNLRVYLLIAASIIFILDKKVCS